MGQITNIQSGPPSGNSVPAAIAIDTATPGLWVGANNGNWVNAVGLTGKGAQLTAAATLTVTNYVHQVVGTTVITTIQLASTGKTLSAGDQVVLIPKAASGQATGTGGNIALATTMVQNKALILTYDGTSWYPSY